MLLPPQITRRSVLGAITLKIPSLLSVPGLLLNDPSRNTPHNDFISAIFPVSPQIFCDLPEPCLIIPSPSQKTLPVPHSPFMSIKMDPTVEEDFSLPDEEDGLLCVGRVEEVGDMAEGGEEEVAGNRRVFVIAGVAEAVCEHDLLRGRAAERAGQSAHASYSQTWMR